MRIQDYCFADGSPSSEILRTGAPDARIPVLMEKWMSCLSDARGSFFDMPLDSGNRFFLLALPDCGKGAALGFTLPRDSLLLLSSCYELYHAFGALTPEHVRNAAQEHLPIKLELTVSPVEPAPIAAAFPDLQGWQMVGDTDKALLTVARMLPLHHPESWFTTFFFAVKPARYADDFTTVACDEVPEGVWRKLKVFHTEFTTDSVFHHRMSALFRRHMRPRILWLSAVSMLLLLLLTGALFFAIRHGRIMRRQRDEWRTESRRLDFLLEKERHDRSREESALEIRRLRERVRELEEKKNAEPVPVPATSAGSGYKSME